MTLIDDRALSGGVWRWKSRLSCLAADGALPSCPSAGRRVAGFARAAKAESAVWNGFLTGRRNRRNSFLFRPVAGESVKCRLWPPRCRRTQRRSWSAWNRAPRPRTSPYARGRIVGRKQNARCGGLAVDAATRFERSEQSFAGALPLLAS